MLENEPLELLQHKANQRLEHLYKRGDKDAWERCASYIELFYNDHASLIEFIQDFDKGVYN